MRSHTRMMNRIGMIWIFLAFSVELNTGSQAKTCLSNLLFQSQWILHVQYFQKYVTIFLFHVSALTKGLTCVTDYCNTVSCSLKRPVTSTRNILDSLEFHWNKDITDITYDNKHGPYKCSLHGAGEDHTCTFTVNGKMTDFDTVAVTLHYLENGTQNSYLLDANFHPAENIKPKPPVNLTLQYTNETHHFFWMNGYEDQDYGRSLPFNYQFLYYKDGDNDRPVSVHPNRKMIEIHEMQLDPSTTYTAMVRTGIRTDLTYSGTWSEWSSAVKWSTTYKVQDDPNKVGMIVIGTILVLGLLILLTSVPFARFKTKEMSWMPTPAPYFQPLYQNYQGNFKCWVLAKSPLQSFHVTEDFATIDKISEVVMTTLQDQVEKAGMYPAAHCHQPYVPTAEPWAPRQMPDTCSETSIPCEEFSFFCEGLPDKVDDLMQSLNVACLSGDVLSLKDSALSLESLEDCEASEAPVIINPTPMCFKQDYCTLTDTPTGLVPTFSGDIELDENTFSD